MDITEILSMLGENGFGADLQTGQLILFGFTVIFFLASLVLCLMAFSAARGAKLARTDSAEHAQMVQDTVLEVRQLSAQMEKTSARYSSLAASAESGEIQSQTSYDGVGRAEGSTDPQAQGSIDQGSIDNAGASSRNLKAAKDAAAVPSSLLTGLLRRR